MLKQYKLPCSLCGARCTREILTRKVVCVDCKLNKQRIMSNLSIYKIPCAGCGAICNRSIRKKNPKCFDCREKQTIISREILHKKKFNERVVKDCVGCGASLEHSKRYDMDFCTFSCMLTSSRKPRTVDEFYQDNK